MRETDQEPALHPEGIPGGNELGDSVWNEPELEMRAPAGCSYREQLAWRRAGVSGFRAWEMTVLAGLTGGLLAAPGVFFAAASGLGAWGPVVGAPLTEELLKQSGMLLLLERYPWYLKRGWQFVLGGLLASLMFATLENLLYGYVYLAQLPAEKWAETMAFRWCWCTLLHVVCSLTGSLGLWRAWRCGVLAGKPARLQDAAPALVAAMIIHGTYNLLAILLR